MVKKTFKYLLFSLILTFQAWTQNITIDASINSNKGWLERPIEGTITVTHDKDTKVDEHSFQLDGKPLTVNLLKNVPMTIGQQNLVVSVYTFTLPPKSPGLYVLENITLNVDNKIYKSLRTTYEVSNSKKPESVAPIPPPSVSDKPITNKQVIFRLESFVEGPNPLYPGQRARFIYRITYNQSIDLTSSKFPLFDVGNDFKKIGDVHFKDYQKGDLTFQDLTLEVEADKIGTFQYGPSFIEGKTLGSSLVRAESPIVEVVVKQFPIEMQPASFNGIIGSQFDAKLNLKTSSKINLGDSIELELLITGPENLADITLPSLQCQPGFSGFFQLDDLPPLAKVVENSKQFIITLRPISSFPKAIPSIELSAYNPSTNKFFIWRSEPIRITISNDSTVQEEIPLKPFKPTDKEILAILDKSSIQVAPIKDFIIQTVAPADLKRNWFKTFWILWVVPLGILVWYAQWRWKNYLEQMKKDKSEESSAQLFEKALKTPDSDPKAVLVLLREACNLRINEYPSSEKEMRIFINKIDRLQYSEDKEFDIETLKKEASLLFKVS